MTPEQLAHIGARIHVDERTGCWLWTGQRNALGYGRIKVDGKRIYAHRWMYTEAVGNIPDGLIVRHQCPYRNCINPSHLLVGTHADNVRDRCLAGHSAAGEHNGRAKLTWDAVRQIRLALQHGTPLAALARTYGVSPRCISHIRDGAQWRDGGDRLQATLIA